MSGGHWDYGAGRACMYLDDVSDDASVAERWPRLRRIFEGLSLWLRATDCDMDRDLSGDSHIDDDAAFDIGRVRALRDIVAEKPFCVTRAGVAGVEEESHFATLYTGAIIGRLNGYVREALLELRARDDGFEHHGDGWGPEDITDADDALAKLCEIANENVRLREALRLALDVLKDAGILPTWAVMSETSSSGHYHSERRADEYDAKVRYWEHRADKALEAIRAALGDDR